MAETNGTLAQQDDEMTQSSNTSAPLRDRLGAHASELRGQASAKAHDYATQGKDKATELLDGLVELVDGAVSSLERNFGQTELGAGASDYARRAAGALSGFTQQVREKDVDELLVDARDAIRNNPAIAIGAAAAIGFVLARLVKAGAEDSDAAAPAPSAADIRVED